MDNEGERQETKGRRWFQDWRWIASIAGLVGALSFAAFAGQLVVNSGKADQRDESINNIEKILEGVAENQEGIEELVSFVRDAQAQASTDRIRPDDLLIFVDLLCSSEDPVRLAACEQITNP